MNEEDNASIYVGFLSPNPYIKPPVIHIGVQDNKRNNLLIATDDRVGEMLITVWGIIQPSCKDENILITFSNND